MSQIPDDDNATVRRAPDGGSMNSRMRAARGLLTCLAWVFVVAAPGIAWCATSTAAMPEHARASRFGGLT